MNELMISPRVYYLPDCKRCDELKVWMKERNIQFEVRWFNTEAQTEFIMRNMFGNPPVLEVGDRLASAEEMFPNGKLNENVVRDVLGIQES